jgi:phosphate transport system ATP-binding protein
MSPSRPKLEVRGLTIRYGNAAAVEDVDLSVPSGSIYAIIGPAGSGKTSLLRTLNLLSLEVDGAVVEGTIRVDGRDILRGDLSYPEVRRRIGMVFATPQPLPGSIYDNLAFGPKLAGVRRAELDGIVESSLRAADLWSEVKDRLRHSALSLSGGQQQRLCIARIIALAPDVILLDEPCSGLDPISTGRIEETMRALAARFTWILVTNNTRQAARVSHRTAFLLLGRLVEEGATAQIFTAPKDPRTSDYVEGRFG